MPITVDANKWNAAPTTKDQDLYAPGAGTPTSQAQIPQGTPIPAGVQIQQHVGRGIPSMQVVPPKAEGAAPPPQMAALPPQNTGRTTIGTFIEPSKTNPLAIEQPQPPSGTVVPPAEPKPPEKKKVDLAMLLLDHVQELGGAQSQDAQKFYDRSQRSLENWLKQPGQITLESINRFLARRPGVMVDLAEQLEPHFAVHGDTGFQQLPTRGKMDCVICTPMVGPPTLAFHQAVVYLAKKYELGTDSETDNVPHRSRNVLAQRFLASGASWSLWLDADTAPPIANESWFRWTTRATAVSQDAAKFDVLQRLLSANKAMVGGVVPSRYYRGPLMVQPDTAPRSHEDKILANDIRKGYRRGLVEVDWIGFGCALIHRQVFLHVQKSCPQLAPETEFSPWRFFQPERDLSGEQSFCSRVKQCGIPIWLDTDLICGHIGQMCLMPEHTAHQNAF